MIRGVRGAVQIETNKRDDILSRAHELMNALIENNNIKPGSVSAVFFTVTPDLTDSFPAEVRKHIGWDLVPFLCSQEIPVPKAMPRVLRVLILFETELALPQIKHQYLGATRALRPDL